MSMKFKRIFALFVILAILFTALVGCSSKKYCPNKNNTIENKTEETDEEQGGTENCC